MVINEFEKEMKETETLNCVQTKKGGKKKRTAGIPGYDFLWWVVFFFRDDKEFSCVLWVDHSCLALECHG